MNNFILKFHRWLTNTKIYFIGLAIIVIIALIACVIGSKGSDLFYAFYFLGVNPVDYSRQGEEVAALIVATLGILIFSGLLITAFSSGIERYIERIREGRKRFSLCKHYVMIGYNHYSVSIIEHILSKNKEANLVILTSKDPEKVRAKLRAALLSSIDKRIIIYAGDGNTEKHISSLHLDKAVSTYIMVEGNEWENQYTQSMLLLKEVSHHAGNRSIKSDDLLPVYLFINDTSTFDLVQRLNLPTEYVGNINSDGKEVCQNIDLHIFNFYDNWARLLWSYNGRKKENNYVYDQLDFEPIEDTDKYVHLVIVGFNSMGRALLMEALRICHYPNFVEETGKNKSIITIIDPKGKTLQKQWKTQYPNIEDIKDVKVEFLSANIEEQVSRERLIKWNRDQEQMLTIAICISDPDLSMSMALSLPEEVFFCYKNLKLKPANETQPDKKQIVVDNPARTRILVRQNVKNSILDIISHNKVKYKNLKLFGTFLNGFDDRLLDDKLSICINGIYLNHSNILSDQKDSEQNLEQILNKENYDQWREKWLDFKETPETNKLATRYQIDYYRTILSIMDRAISKHGTIPETLTTELAHAEHRRWIAERIMSGWRQIKNGEKRIDALRIHTCITSHANLPEAELVKDKNVISFARHLVNFVNEQK